jgi:hypothetical protein
LKELKKNGHTSNPEGALLESKQGYFNYLHGIMLSQTINQAENISRAIELGLSMDMDLRTN